LNIANTGTIGTAAGGAYAYFAPPLADGSTLPSTKFNSELAFNADVQPLPTISQVVNGEGSISGGTKVTILGSDFTGATAVTFGGVPAAGYSVGADSTIIATAPAATAPGAVDIAVKTLAGTTSAVPADKFTYTACVVPKMTSRKLKVAKPLLTKSGCTLGKVTKKTRKGKAPGTVLSQGAKPGTVLPVGATVNVKTAKKPKPKPKKKPASGKAG
jgi:hypothetical protein